MRCASVKPHGKAEAMVISRTLALEVVHDDLLVDENGVQLLMQRVLDAPWLDLAWRQRMFDRLLEGFELGTLLHGLLKGVKLPLRHNVNAPHCNAIHLGM